MADQEELDDLKRSLAELSRSQRELEQRVARLEGVSLPVRPAAFTPASNSVVETRLGLTVVNRVGVVTLILGIAFFFKWAVDNNWIGPWSRVVFGVIAGIVALGIAELLSRKTQGVFAQGITGTGLAVIYLAVDAAYGMYQLLPQLVTLFLLAAVTVLAFALSLRYRAEAIAGLALFGGYLTPLLLNRGADHPWFLLSYAAVLNVAALMLAKRERWTALQVLAVVASFTIYFVWWVQNGQPGGDTLPAAVFIVLYLATFLGMGTLSVPSLAVLFAVSETFAVWHAHPWRCAAFEILFGAAALYRFSRTHMQTEYLSGQLGLLIGAVLVILHWASHAGNAANRLSVETMSVSILLAVYALVLVGIGVARRAAIDRVTGLALIAFVIVKLYVFDVWQLGHLYRIAGFVVLGLLLISTSFLYSRFRNAIEALLKG